MLEALEPCCAQALTKASVETTAKSHFVMRSSSGRAKAAIVPESACSLRVAVHWRSQTTPFHSLEMSKMIKTLIAVAVAGAFALPVAALASAQGDNIVLAQSGGGGDTGSSVRQPGANPPGSASPGAPRDTTTSTDRDTGAASRTNPNGGMSG